MSGFSWEGEERLILFFVAPFSTFFVFSFILTWKCLVEEQLCFFLSKMGLRHIVLFIWDGRDGIWDGGLDGWEVGVKCLFWKWMGGRLMEI